MNLLENKNSELWKCKNVIYCYTNKINGKKYIGQTSCNLKYRHKQHINSKDNNYFHNAIHKYGIENFKLEILHIADIYSLDLLEIYYIEKFNLLNKKYGYNTKSGGSHGKHSEETRKKIGEMKKGIKTGTRNEETKRKMSENHRNINGINNPNYNKFGKEHHNSKKICQYDINMNLIKIWDSIADASRELNISVVSISNCCRGKSKSSGKDINGNKIIWKYYDKEVK